MPQGVTVELGDPSQIGPLLQQLMGGAMAMPFAPPAPSSQGVWVCMCLCVRV
jgi:hypothetical protein